MSGDSVSTRNVWPNYDSSNVQTAAKTKSQTLGKDEFLRILVTQLKNQDPMQPLQDKDFIAQMAQFSSVEQLMNMGEQMTKFNQNLGTASSMIGKEVSWNEYAQTGELLPVSGKVDSIVIKDGIQYARVGDKNISLDKILSIAEGGASTNG
ncbi:hypothetical protein Back11_22150 [Paenibacillus baekrokdamisoli]|uniref:Uncharacterized protein n=1 Tax=Paenibacillus baekrokdamisoli TaxID=1712516 RepID=A0A3G9IPT8_9BACL|nr:flagellar hook capping FlgD N-terminal domain-containing protein [Paenibacillus baekrokdamisoli]MBB3069776.1 flagellar basal-body rod modification protein FlgD [Paenibacillus baekrokdamisoli]BBH20870.1 hypothetical protein Back11_22150 [Paenibacillus baekrokdamisoli]